MLENALNQTDVPAEWDQAIITTVYEKRERMRAGTEK